MTSELHALADKLTRSAEIISSGDPYGSNTFTRGQRMGLLVSARQVRALANELEARVTDGGQL